MAKKRKVVIPFSKVKKEIVDILVKEGYLKKLKAQSSKLKAQKELVVVLNYDKGGNPAITKIERVSKPGLRIYKKSRDMFPILSGLGLSIVSTSKGLMTDKQARKKNLGGEVICRVW